VNNRFRSAVRLFACAGVVLVIAGCAGAAPQATASQDANEVPPAVTEPPFDHASLIYPEPSDGRKRCGSMTRYIDLAPYTTSILAGYGWTFVLADVVAAGPAFYNTPDGSRPDAFSGSKPSIRPDPGAQPSVYTPIDVQVISSINGSLADGPAQVLVMGGIVDCFVMHVSPMPVIEKGSRYVLVLDGALGSDGKTEMQLQQVMLAWPVDSKGTITTDEGQMSLDELTEIIRVAEVKTAP
jgi:hypothetical protein